LKVAAIVPAYNEERRIGNVLDVLKHSAAINEIIVVSDGSIDRTYEVASECEGVRAIKLDKNAGKGGAMLAGVQATDADIVVFFDADLIGLTPAQVGALVEPVVKYDAGMSIGIFRQGRRSTDWAQKIAPYISGQRCLHREELLSITGLGEARFGAEIAIGRHARSKGLKAVHVPFLGVTHPMKEEKLGFFPGAVARAKMYWEIIKLLVVTSPAKLKKKAEIVRDTSAR
jgi:glycosyltransferase involved in cell wall biosynthesis